MADHPGFISTSGTILHTQNGVHLPMMDGPAWSTEANFGNYMDAESRMDQHFTPDPITQQYPMTAPQTDLVSSMELFSQHQWRAQQPTTPTPVSRALKQNLGAPFPTELLLGDTPPGDTPRSPSYLPDDYPQSPRPPTTASNTATPASRAPASDAVRVAVFLEWLHAIEPDSTAFELILAKKGFGMIPLSSPGRKRKQSTQPKAPSTTRKVKSKPTATSGQWWDRFFRLTKDDLSRSLSETNKTCLLNPKAFLEGLDRVQDPTGVDGAISDLGRKVLYTLRLDQTEFRASVMKIAMRLFFFVIGQTKAANPAAASSFRPINDHAEDSARCRVFKIGDIDLSLLYHDLSTYLPDQIHHEESFKRQFRIWRQQGAAYAFMAQHIGLGSLVLLRVSVMLIWASWSSFDLDSC